MTVIHPKMDHYKVFPNKFLLWFNEPMNQSTNFIEAGRAGYGIYGREKKRCA
jgi:hypothetical protein